MESQKAIKGANLGRNLSQRFVSEIVSAYQRKTGALLNDARNFGKGVFG